MGGIMIRMSVEVTHFGFICTAGSRGINPYQRVGAFDSHENWTDNGSMGKEMDSERKSKIKSISSYYLLTNFSANDYGLLQFGGRLPSSGGQNLNGILR